MILLNHQIWAYWWNFGSLLAFSLIIQIITGVTLAMHYDTDIYKAFNSVEQIMRDINNGWLIRYLHSNTASAFFFIVYLHIGRGLYYGSYKTPRTLVWTIGTIILILMMATAFLGYVLPFGQMSLWGATVITSLMSAIPWVGQDIVQFIWGGFSVNHATLNRFFALHFVLPFILAALALMHLIALHEKAGSGNPLGISGNPDKLPFAPYFIFKDLITIFVYILVLSVFVFYMPNVLGDSENYVKANPMKTPSAIVPEWYLLSFYAILRSIPNKLLGVIAMFSAILMLLVLAFADMSKLRGVQFKPFNKITLFLFVGTFLVLTQLGAKHVESPFIEFGQLCTALYFAYFLIIVPYVFLFENALSYLRSTKYLVENTMSKHDDKEEVITKIDALVQNDIYSDDDNEFLSDTHNVNKEIMEEVIEENKEKVPAYAIMQSNLFGGYNFLTRKHCNNSRVIRNFHTSSCLKMDNNNDNNTAMDTNREAPDTHGNTPGDLEDEVAITKRVLGDDLTEFKTHARVWGRALDYTEGGSLDPITYAEMTTVMDDSGAAIEEIKKELTNRLSRDDSLQNDSLTAGQVRSKAESLAEDIHAEIVCEQNTHSAFIGVDASFTRQIINNEAAAAQRLADIRQRNNRETAESNNTSSNQEHEGNLPESSSDAPRPWGVYFQDSGTSQMEILTELHDNILFYLIIILFGVGWLLLTIINKFGNMAWPLSQRFTSHGTTIEIIWTITPGIILILIAFPSFKLLYLMDEITDPILVIYGEGHQWYWSYQYIDFVSDEGDLLEFDSYLVPETDLQKGALRMLEVDNRLVIPELTHTRFVISGADVIHSFACPALGLKCDAYPGRTNQLSLMINRAATYFGQCSEICGIYHSNMPIVFEAVSVEKFIEWVRQK